MSSRSADRSAFTAFVAKTLLAWLVFVGLSAGPAQAEPGRFISSAGWQNFRGDSIPLNKGTAFTPYFYWYEPDTGIGNNSFTIHPDYYWDRPGIRFSFSSPEWHAREVRRINEAGIDVILPDYWGGDPDRFPAENDWSNRGLEALSVAMDGGGKNPKVGMFYDTNTLGEQRDPITGQPISPPRDLSSRAGIDQFYRTIRDFYSRVHPKRWARVDGRAVVWLYLSRHPDNITKRAFDEAQRRFARDFGGIGLYFIGNTGWRTRADGRLVDMTYAWGAAGQRDGIISAFDVVSVGPGIYYPGDPVNRRREVDRLDGKVYKSAWEAALRTNKRFVFIETWNEFGESTAVSPILESEIGTREWDATKRYTQRLHTRYP